MYVRGVRRKRNLHMLFSTLLLVEVVYGWTLEWRWEGSRKEEYSRARGGGLGCKSELQEEKKLLGGPEGPDLQNGIICSFLQRRPSLSAHKSQCMKSPSVRARGLSAEQGSSKRRIRPKTVTSNLMPGSGTSTSCYQGAKVQALY